MPRTADGKPVLYKPFKSKKAGKKMSVYVKSASGGTKSFILEQQAWMIGGLEKHQLLNVSHSEQE